METGVIPIRGMTPPSPMLAAPATLATTAPRARRVPVERRPWRVLLVPPTPGARTRTFDVARWQARMMLSALVMLLLVAAGAVTAVIVALDRPDLLTSRSEVASLRGRLTAVEDSLALARAVLAESGDAPPDSSVATPAPAMSPSTPVATRVPLLPRVRARASSAFRSRASGGAPLSIEGLPVIGAIVSGFSNARRHPILHILRPHLGIDIAAKRGTRIAAPAAGRVTYVGRNFAFGLTVDIEHAGGITTRYAHLRAALVHEGERVARGSAIATVGSSGLTTGPHLHYEVAVNGRQVDPLRFRMPELGDSAVASAVHSSPPFPGVGAPAAHEDPASPAVP